MPHDKRNPDDFTPDPLEPSRDLLTELERMDLAVKAQGIEENRTMFDPTVPPKRPTPEEEGITDRAGEREVDLQRDTINLDGLTLGAVDPGHGELMDRVDLEDVDLI